MDVDGKSDSDDNCDSQEENQTTPAKTMQRGEGKLLHSPDDSSSEEESDSDEEDGNKIVVAVVVVVDVVVVDVVEVVVDNFHRCLMLQVEEEPVVHNCCR